MKNEIVVYTAIFGGYDDLIEPEKKYPGCDYICYTDNPNVCSDFWRVICVDKSSNPILSNRKLKIIGNELINSYKYNLYIDANVKLMCNPLDLVAKYFMNDSNGDILIPKHLKRTCIYKEIIECVIWGKSNIKESIELYSYYRNIGFPEEYGLNENNIILRSNTVNTVKIMNLWWQLFLTQKIKRDQLYFSFILWEQGIRVNYMSEHSRDNISFSLQNHSWLKNRSVFSKVYTRIIREIKKLFVPFLFKVKVYD